MLVLHGFWSPERGLGLWAEDSERAVTSRSQALRSARPHPFAVSVEVLAKTHHGKPGAATLRLPSLAKSPLDSPELIRVAPRGAARFEPVLLPWRVPTIDLDPSAALGWLATVADGSDIEPCARSLTSSARLPFTLGGSRIPMRDDHGLTALDDAACWELLPRARVGRLAWRP